MQGKHAKSAQGNIATSQPAAVVVRGPSTAHDSSVGRADQQRLQQAQSVTDAPKPTSAEAEAAVLNSAVVNYAEMEGTQLGHCPDRPEASAAHGSAGTAQQGTVDSHTSAGTAGEDKGEHSPLAEAASKASHISAAQPSGSPPDTPSWQRTCPGQPPTPLSSHPIADELTASSDSLTSSGDATLLGQLSHGQAHADLPTTVTIRDTTQHSRTQAGDIATSQGTQHVMSLATAAGGATCPPLLDTNAVLLQFSHALDEDRLLSPASTAASERMAPPLPLPPPAAASPLFCRNPHAAECMLSADSPQGTAKSPEATPHGPQDIASSLQGGCSLQSLADMPDYAHAVSEPWRPVNEADAAAALSFLTPAAPSSSALSSATSSPLGSTDMPAASSALHQLGATKAAYCTAAEQLQSAVQQATKLYTTAFPPAELTDGSDSQHDTAKSDAGHTAVFDSMQHASGSPHTDIGRASDSSVMRASRSVPSISSSAAAAWVPQGGQGSMLPCAVNLSHDQHDGNTGED